MQLRWLFGISKQSYSTNALAFWRFLASKTYARVEVSFSQVSMKDLSRTFSFSSRGQQASEPRMYVSIGVYRVFWSHHWKLRIFFFVLSFYQEGNGLRLILFDPGPKTKEVKQIWPSNKFSSFVVVCACVSTERCWRLRNLNHFITMPCWAVLTLTAWYTTELHKCAWWTEPFWAPKQNPGVGVQLLAKELLTTFSYHCYHFYISFCT